VEFVSDSCSFFSQLWTWTLKSLHTLQHFSVFVIKFCVLQVEVDDDTGADIASGISNKSHDAVNCGLPALRQVSNFMFDGFD